GKLFCEALEGRTLLLPEPFVGPELGQRCDSLSRHSIEPKGALHQSFRNRYSLPRVAKILLIRAVGVHKVCGSWVGLVESTSTRGTYQSVQYDINCHAGPGVPSVCGEIRRGEARLGAAGGCSAARATTSESGLAATEHDVRQLISDARTQDVRGTFHAKGMSA